MQATGETAEGSTVEDDTAPLRNINQVIDINHKGGKRQTYSVLAKASINPSLGKAKCFSRTTLALAITNKEWDLLQY